MEAHFLAAVFALEHVNRQHDGVTGFAPSGWRNLRTRGQRRTLVHDDTGTHLHAEYVIAVPEPAAVTTVDVRLGAPVAPDGILIVAGPPMRSGVGLQGAHVLDVAPTMLYLQGLPLAADMPGGVFREALSEAFLASDFGVASFDRVVVHLGGSGAIDNVNVEVIPEPGTLPMLGAGLIGLTLVGGRRR